MIRPGVDAEAVRIFDRTRGHSRAGNAPPLSSSCVVALSLAPRHEIDNEAPANHVQSWALKKFPKIQLISSARELNL